MSEEILKWDMKTRLEKLDKLKSKYPEIERSGKIYSCVVWITDVWTDDKDVDTAFDKLEVLLHQKNDGD